MKRTTFARPLLAAAVFLAALAPPAMLSAQEPSAAPVTGIPANSPLLNIDPRLVEAGRARIAKMDAARIATRKGGEAEFPAFHVIGNTYAVGVQNETAYLIRTSDGLILIDTTYEATAPWVAEAIESLGFKLADIKILFGSHAHLDHMGGHAWFKRRVPGAQVMVMDADAPTVERGVAARPGSELGGQPPVKVDRVLKDGDRITLGDVTVTAWKTAGHTPGATSLEWRTNEAGKTYDVLLVGSQQAAEKLVPEGYPGIVGDQIHAWSRLLSLRPDVWFGGHPWQHDNVGKYEALKAGTSPNPFIDPDGYHQLIAARAFDFVQELRRQQAAAGH